MTQALEKLKQDHQQNYSDMPFDEFKEKIRQKYYADLSVEDFEQKLNPRNQETRQTEVVDEVTKQGSTISYLLDQAKLGLSEFATGLIPSFDLLTTDITEYGDITNPDNAARFEADARAKREKLQSEVFGVEGIEPRSKTERLLGAGVRATAAEGPLALVGARGPVSAVSEITQGVLAGSAGQFGAESAGETAQALGLPETAVQTAQILGGVAAGVTPGAATSATRAGFTAATEGVNTVRKKRAELKQTVDGVSNYVADQSIRATIDNALTADPSTPSVIESVKELSRVLPNVDDNSIPPFIALQTNPVIRQNFEYLIKKDPVFRAEAVESIATLKNLVEQRKGQLFGKGGPEVESQILRSLPTDYTSTIKQAAKRIDAIDTNIHRLTDTIKTDKDEIDIGAKAENLMAAKESAVRAKLSPQYTKLIDDAELSGIKLPSAGRRNIYNYATTSSLQNIFNKFPTVYGKIQTNFKPRRIKDPTTNRVVTVFDPVSVKQVDSLKREINAQLRKKNLKADERRLLEDLRQITKAEIEKMPEEFVDTYQSLDRQYYTELGIPFSSAGARQFDAARFSSQVGTYLSKPEQARDFLAITGESGVPVVRDAILMRMQAKTMSDDIIDLRKYGNFLRANERVINLVPGLREQLSDVNNAMRQMESTRATLNEQYAVRSKELTEGLYKRLNDRGLDGVINDMLSSPQKTDKYLADIKNFTPETAKIVRKGFQRALVDKAQNASGVSFIEFVRKNENTFSKVFGKQYLKSIESLGQLNDLLKNVDPTSARFATAFRNQDQLEKNIGISAPQVQSILRDRITNVGTKLAIVLSKINSAKVVDKRDQALKQLMTDPDALNTLRQQAEQSQVSLSPASLKKTLQTLSASMNSKAVIALESVQQEIQEPLSETPINIDY